MALTSSGRCREILLLTGLPVTGAIAIPDSCNLMGIRCSSSPCYLSSRFLLVNFSCSSYIGYQLCIVSGHLEAHVDSKEFLLGTIWDFEGLVTPALVKSEGGEGTQVHVLQPPTALQVQEVPGRVRWAWIHLPGQELVVVFVQRRVRMESRCSLLWPPDSLIRTSVSREIMWEVSASMPISECEALANEKCKDGVMECLDVTKPRLGTECI